MTDTLRALPAPDAPRTTCEGCGATIVWALTVAGPNGRGGKAMPLDPLEDLAGNIAVTAPSRNRLLARALHKGEQVDRPLEYVGMPHFATCAASSHPVAPEAATNPPRPSGRRTHSPGGRR